MKHTSVRCRISTGRYISFVFYSLCSLVLAVSNLGKFALTELVEFW